MNNKDSDFEEKFGEDTPYDLRPVREIDTPISKTEKGDNPQVKRGIEIDKILTLCAFLVLLMLTISLYFEIATLGTRLETISESKKHVGLLETKLGQLDSRINKELPKRASSAYLKGIDKSLRERIADLNSQIKVHKSTSKKLESELGKVRGELPGIATESAKAEVRNVLRREDILNRVKTLEQEGQARSQAIRSEIQSLETRINSQLDSLLKIQKEHTDNLLRAIKQIQQHQLETSLTDNVSWNRTNKTQKEAIYKLLAKRLKLQVSEESNHTFLIHTNSGIKFVLVPGRVYSEIGRPPLKAFLLSQTELTQGQFESAKKISEKWGKLSPIPQDFPGKDHPIHSLSIEHVKIWLNVANRNNFLKSPLRLPSNEEWTHAFLAGRDSKFWWDDSKPLKNYVWFKANSQGRLTSVTDLKRNKERWSPLGFLDMIGHVGELTQQGHEFWLRGGHFLSIEQQITQGAKKLSEKLSNQKQILVPLGLRIAMNID